MTFDEVWAKLKSKYPKVIISAEQLSAAMRELDAVSVVRCQNCKSYTKIVDDMTGLRVCGVFASPMRENDYCSFGDDEVKVTIIDVDKL